MLTLLLLVFVCLRRPGVKTGVQVQPGGFSGQWRGCFDPCHPSPQQVGPCYLLTAERPTDWSLQSCGPKCTFSL